MQPCDQIEVDQDVMEVETNKAVMGVTTPCRGRLKKWTVEVQQSYPVGTTLASASTMEADLRAFDGDKSAKAKKVGELLAERAKSAGVEAVVFDRGGNKYHGRVAALAEGAREGGLAF